MTLDEIKALGLRLAEVCQKYGIAELSVFGSVARGDAGPDSDVDLLYVRVPGNDLGMSYFALQDDLEKLFGRPVDLVPKDGLRLTPDPSVPQSRGAQVLQCRLGGRMADFPGGSARPGRAGNGHYASGIPGAGKDLRAGNGSRAWSGR